jgi:hypothetical protein
MVEANHEDVAQRSESSTMVGVGSTPPNPNPARVIDREAVAGMLGIPTFANDATGASKLKSVGETPGVEATETVAARSFPVPAGLVHRMEVDDSHSAPKHGVAPSSAVTPPYGVPMLNPTMVTVAAPLAGPLATSMAETAGESYEKANIAVPRIAETSTVAGNAALTPARGTHRTKESETQLVVRHALVPRVAV